VRYVQCGCSVITIQYVRWPVPVSRTGTAARYTCLPHGYSCQAENLPGKEKPGAGICEKAPFENLLLICIPYTGTIILPPDHESGAAGVALPAIARPIVIRLADRSDMTGGSGQSRPGENAQRVAGSSYHTAQLIHVAKMMLVNTRCWFLFLHRFSSLGTSHHPKGTSMNRRNLLRSHGYSAENHHFHPYARYPHGFS
jgi:hypothetical protein